MYSYHPNCVHLEAHKFNGHFLRINKLRKGGGYLEEYPPVINRSQPCHVGLNMSLQSRCSFARASITRAAASRLLSPGIAVVIAPRPALSLRTSLSDWYGEGEEGGGGGGGGVWV